MDADSKTSTQPAEDTGIFKETESSSNKAQSNCNSFQDLMDTFFTKAEEYETHSRAGWDIYWRFKKAGNVVERHWGNTNLDPNEIDLDSLSTLDDYVSLFILEGELVKHETDWFASQRSIMKTLDESLAVGMEIMSRHAIEFEQVGDEVKERFIKLTAKLSKYNIRFVDAWRRVLFEPW
ncbi:hypothetical protein KCU85_g519, partial [Aureobasidium melanogenum]